MMWRSNQQKSRSSTPRLTTIVCIEPTWHSHAAFLESELEKARLDFEQAGFELEKSRQ